MKDIPKSYKENDKLYMCEIYLKNRSNPLNINITMQQFQQFQQAVNFPSSETSKLERISLEDCQTHHTHPNRFRYSFNVQIDEIQAYTFYYEREDKAKENKKQDEDITIEKTKLVIPENAAPEELMKLLEKQQGLMNGQADNMHKLMERLEKLEKLENKKEGENLLDYGKE